MRGKVARFLRKAVYSRPDLPAIQLRRTYKNLKKDFYGSTTKEKHTAYFLMSVANEGATLEQIEQLEQKAKNESNDSE